MEKDQKCFNIVFVILLFVTLNCEYWKCYKKLIHKDVLLFTSG